MTQPTAQYNYGISLAPEMQPSKRFPDQFLSVVCTVFTADGTKKGDYEFPVCAIPQAGDIVTLRGETLWNVVRRAIDARDAACQAEIWLWVEPLHQDCEEECEA